MQHLIQLYLIFTDQYSAVNLSFQSYHPWLSLNIMLSVVINANMHGCTHTESKTNIEFIFHIVVLVIIVIVVVSRKRSENKISQERVIQSYGVILLVNPKYQPEGEVHDNPT